MRCRNSIPVEICQATPRLSTGKYGVLWPSSIYWQTKHKTVYIQLLFFLSLFLSDLRQPTQDAPEEVRARDFRRELEERERVAARDKTRERGPRGELFCDDFFFTFFGFSFIQVLFSLA